MTSTSNGTQAVDRAALLVATVVRSDAPIPFVELAEECDLPRSTTSRLLTALERTELLERDGDGGYVAGPLFWEYSARHDPWSSLSQLAQPVMDLIGDATGETVNLGVVRGDRVVQIAQVDSTFLLSPDWTQIEDIPAHASALGKVMLAHDVLQLPAGELESVTEHTIANRKRLARDLTQVRNRGYATTIDELEIGLSGIGVPIRLRHEVVATLGVSGPTQRFSGRLAELSELLITQADRLGGILSRRIPADKENTSNTREGVA